MPGTPPDFAYPAAGGSHATVAIFAEDVALGRELAEDARAAGFDVARCARAAALMEAAAQVTADVIWVQAAALDDAALDALTALEARLERRGGQLIVVTGMGALEHAFAALAGPRTTILIDPPHAERLIAFGRAMANLFGGGRVREFSEEDRISMLRLAEQVERLAYGLGTKDGPGAEKGAPRVGSPSLTYTIAPADTGTGAGGRGDGGLPDPAYVRAVLRQRQARAQYFGADLFADPAWDMLLDLTAARGEGQRVSITSLCIASGVPPTTALRWIGQMIDAGLFVRVEDAADRRRAFIGLSEQAAQAMGRYFRDMRAGLAAL